MRNIAKKILIYASIVAVLLVTGLFIYGDSDDTKQPEYTTLSVKPQGTKALYILTQQMGFNVETFQRPTRLLSGEGTMVTVNPDAELFNDRLELKYLMQWLMRGNVLVLIGNEVDNYNIDKLTFRSAEKMDGYDNASLYRVGKGKLIFVDGCDDYTNDGLKNTSNAVKFISILDSIGYKRVLFNEYYHAISDGGVTWWDLLGSTGQLITLQLFIALAILLLIKSRRFGKPIEVFNIIKRKENENLFALANLYIKAGANGLVLETYLTSFKAQLAKFLGFNTLPDDVDIVDAASKNNILRSMDIKGLLDTCERYIESGNKNLRQLMQLVERIEHIRKGIKQ